MTGFIAAAGVVESPLSAAPGVAATFWMSADQLARAFTGAEITGTYADGRTFDERYDADGSLVYLEHEPRRELTGHWSIVSGRFCTIYATSGTGGCFRVRQNGRNCFEFYFETRTEAEMRGAKPGTPSWTARAWRTDASATCNGEPSV
jgi:hypothetical protein